MRHVENTDYEKLDVRTLCYQDGLIISLIAAHPYDLAI